MKKLCKWLIHRSRSFIRISLKQKVSKVYLPDPVDQRVHALVHQVSVGLPQTKALFFEHFGKAQQVRGTHLKVGIIQKDDLQQQRLFSKTLQEPPGHLPLRLKEHIHTQRHITSHPTKGTF